MGSEFGPNQRYLRVLPRDLFNESSLLKCLGRLWILLEQAEGRHYAHLGPDQVNHFDIAQDPGSGNLLVTNLVFRIQGVKFGLERPLNSREPWPLYIESREDDPDWDAIPVFDQEGNFSKEMRAFLFGEILV